MKHINKIAISAFALAAIFSGNASAALVTNNVIFGSGVSNGSFTVDQNAQMGVELGLRGKLRHNASGIPENTFNEFNPGMYYFDAGVAPTQSGSTATWSFEWSINTNFDDNLLGLNLDDLVYELALDMDPSLGTNFFVFDPINGFNTGEADGHWDHSIGDNTTAQSAGTEATDIASYTALLADNNLAQNSWKPHWFIPGFDPTVDGTYDIMLSAYDPAGQNALVASTSIQIIVGQGGSTQVPEPASLLIFAAGLLGLGAARKRKTK
ncbi:PEP-CTERM sorting domain-containing protein [Neptunicella sp. SCSIO 80796]|uniref:PEP-CTERM sorting domain-containing protein n=1 Tax=Neptunicella plasticusilytica TaxID=3117012 RepID=UPI003A4DE28B